MQLEINGINLPVHPALHTWQDLLQELESKHLGQGKMISSVRFDGNEVSNFGKRLPQSSAALSGRTPVQASPWRHVKSLWWKPRATWYSATSLVEVRKLRHPLPTKPTSSWSIFLKGKMLHPCARRGGCPCRSFHQVEQRRTGPRRDGPPWKAARVARQQDWFKWPYSGF